MNVLFLGEGDLKGPARYLAAVLAHAGWHFDHRHDLQKIPTAWLNRRYDVIVLSDYRRANWDKRREAWLTNQVAEQGTGLLMIGGWASFTGSVGGYAGSPVEALLPVRCVPGDDRVNWASGVAILPAERHGFGGFRWNDPPVVCGYHRAVPKAATDTALVFRELHFRAGRPRLGRPRPALVFGRAGAARTAAFLTDCAPHWAGGLVDWGKRRVTIRVKRGPRVEVGVGYVNFFQALIRSLLTS